MTAHGERPVLSRLAISALARDAPDLSGVSTAVDAAATGGVLGQPDADQADRVPTDDAAPGSPIAAYVIPGSVLAADAVALVTDGGGTATLDSLAGSPLPLTLDGETLLVNGRPLTGADIALGNVTVHGLGAVFLPEAAAQEAPRGLPRSVRTP